jgi:Flp pilus assembly protein TadD
MFGLTMRRLALPVLMLSLALGGCFGRGNSDDITGSIAPPERSAEQWRAERDQLGQSYRGDPTNRNTALAYARSLRASKQAGQAVAVLQEHVLIAPDDRVLLGEYGRALADAGQNDQALNVLGRAQSADQPDWRIYNVIGTVHDSMGDHRAAQLSYIEALKIVPGEPAVLGNQGLSLAMSGELPRAESILRQAAQTEQRGGKARQNLALVLAMSGKMKEAEGLIRADLPPDQAEQNIATLRGMTGTQNTWKQLSKIDGKKPKGAERAHAE